MNNPYYIAAHAANQLMEKQKIISNDLANISTTGFKAQYLLLISKKKIAI